MSVSLTITAQAAAHAVRDLTGATLGGAGYRTPADVDGVLTELSVLVHGLPQLLAQAAGWLDRQHQASKVGHDTGAGSEACVHDAVGDLERAGRQARVLAYILDSARESTSHLTALAQASCRVGGGRR